MVRWVWAGKAQSSGPCQDYVYNQVRGSESPMNDMSNIAMPVLGYLWDTHGVWPWLVYSWSTRCH